LDFSPLDEKIIKAIKNSDPSLEGVLRYSQLDAKKRLLRLRHKTNGDCIFLNSKGLCEVYPVRPNVCKIFPFWVVKLISGKFKIIAHDDEPQCQIICSMLKKDEDVETSLPKKQQLEIKNIFQKIKREKV
jgi:Fe-S-cluster containining protein